MRTQQPPTPTHYSNLKKNKKSQAHTQNTGTQNTQKGIFKKGEREREREKKKV